MRKILPEPTLMPSIWNEIDKKKILTAEGAEFAEKTQFFVADLQGSLPGQNAKKEIRENPCCSVEKKS